MRSIGAAAVALAIALGLFACGNSEPSAAEKREAAERRVEARERKAKRKAIALAVQCESQLGSFLEALEELEGRLEVGVNYETYFSEVGNIQIAYNRIPIDELEPECLTLVGVPSEDAFQAYSEAADAWEECFETLSCEDEDPVIQNKWAKASRQAVRADEGLDLIREP